MKKNKRKAHRIATNFLVKFFRSSVDRSMRRTMQGIVKNCSTGGMFISTDHPFSRGSVFTFEFELESETKHRIRIQARAIVRWVQRLINNPGMGVEFILFNERGDHEFSNWLARQY
jgi:phenylpropionate dioxygenase-like ring-hydroxylating dioxygenase large terminal subunit